MVSSLETATKAKAYSAGDKLCAAVAEWVTALGGRPAIVSGITIRHDRLFRFEVSVRVTGSAPKLKYELPPLGMRLRKNAKKRKRK